MPLNAPPGSAKRGMFFLAATDGSHADAHRLARPADVARFGEQRQEEVLFTLVAALARRLALLRLVARNPYEVAIVAFVLPPPRRAPLPNEIGRPPRGAPPESQFFTVPSMYLNSVTFSSNILPIWLV
jgi:hypothetical protein